MTFIHTQLVRYCRGNSKTVQEVLGHASFSLTADTYSHVVEQFKDVAATRMDAFLKGGHP